MDSVLGALLESPIQGIELYYNIALAKSLALTLDFQYMDSAFPNVDNSFVVGVRLNASF